MILKPADPGGLSIFNGLGQSFAKSLDIFYKLCFFPFAFQFFLI